MSTLKVTDIQSNGTGFNDVVSFQNASGTENGTLCRAFVNFDGTFGTSPFTTANGGIRAAFNVSSVTDNAQGQYTINFTNAMPDANYAMGYLCQEDANGGNRNINGYSTRSTTAMPVDTRNASNALADFSHNTVCFFR